MKGRPRLNNNQKNIKGTLQPCREVEVLEVDKIIKLPSAPKWLTKIGKKIYKYKGIELIQTGQIDSQNIELFVSFCNEFANYIESQTEINNFSQLEFLNKRKTDHLEILMKRNKIAWDRVIKLSIEFGITPSSRSRIIGNMKEVKSENDSFFD